MCEGIRAPFVPTGSRAPWTSTPPPPGSPPRREDLLVILQVFVDVPDVEEGIFAEADVDKGCLHARQDLEHPTLVDVAGQPRVPGVRDHELRQMAVLQDRHAGLHHGRVHDDLTLHGRPDWPNRLRRSLSLL